MRGQNGFSLIDVLLALALAGILGAAIPSALSQANLTAMRVNQRTIAESLARNQIDFIQNQTYDSGNITPVYNLLPDLPPYNIETTVTRLDPRNNGILSDDGMQLIVVDVKLGTQTLFTLVDYKVNIQ